MMEGWKEYRLGDVLKKIIGGGTPSKSKPEYWNGPIYWCSVKDMSDGKLKISQTEDTITQLGLDNSSANLIKAGNLIISTRMGLGRAFINLSDMAINQDLKALIPNDKTTTEFLLWLLLIKKEELEGLGTGATVKGIRLETLRNIKINLPPLPTQRKIAKILSAYDDLIENNLKRIKLLEEMAQITYEEWFVRMKFPGHETAVFDEETGLPEGWKKVKLGECIKFIKGKKVDELFDEKIEGTAKVLLLDALEGGKFQFTKIGNHTKTKRGDIMMLMDGARSSFVFYSEDGIIGSTMAKIVSKQIPPTLLYHFFKSILDWLQTNNTGAAIPHANKSFINSIKFTLPKDKILHKWDEQINAINKSIWNLKDQNQLLKEARDILLPRLMTGMISV